MNVGQLFEVKQPVENPDWGFGRTCRALLRRQNAEFMQSVFSVDVGGFTTPNRDYPLEGLTAVLQGENWKLVDAIPFRLEVKGKPSELKPTAVKIFPWKVAYSYSIDGGHAALEIEYYLMRKPKFPSLSLLFRLSGIRNTTLFLKPLFDVRHMYSASSPQEHSYLFSPRGLSVSAHGKEAIVASPSFVAFSPAVTSTQEWWYKLGTGFREERLAGARFIGENRPLYAPGILSAALNGEVGVQISCGEESHKSSVELRDHDEKQERARAVRVLSPFSKHLDAAGARWGPQMQKALAARTLCLLDKFDFSSTGFGAPDAGSMWFRNVWFRDAFEVIHNNLPLFLAARKRDLRAILANAVSLEKDGRLPNKLSERAGGPPDYSAVDSTLLCLLAGLDYLSVQRDAPLSEYFQRLALKFISASEASGMLSEDGLLETPADYSWIDSFISLRSASGELNVPSRVPPDWRVGHSVQSRYYLVELNALWLLVLCQLSVRGMRNASEILPQAEKSFRKTFFHGGKLAGIADQQGRRSFDEASPPIQALALLPDLFSDAGAKQVLESVSDCLVYRNKKLFGILVKRSSDRVYFNDAQYHGAVCWPRDSYYLHKLLLRLNDPRAEEILLSHLEHQMEEGAVFYSHELFSLPEGTNPSPTADAQKPVPVKNPAQLFSQWCQPYHEFLTPQGAYGSLTRCSTAPKSIL